MKFVLTIDQGTTGTTASLVDQNGQLAFSHSEDFEQIYPQPGWVEHDPEKIWGTVERCVSHLFSDNSIDVSSVVAIGITNQRETVVVWDRKTHQCVYNAIVWQCRRTSDFCKKIKKHAKKIKLKTGLVIDPYFSGSKIRWILENDKSLRKKIDTLAAGTIDSFLIYRLTDGKSHVTDVSNASRTQLMNIKSGMWDRELLKIFSVPEEILPEIKSSSGVLGYTEKLSFLPDGIPISGVAGDQQAALFGQACFDVGEAKCTYGTGSFLLMNTGSKMVQSKTGMLTTVAWKLGSDKKLTYALEGSVFICGASVQFLRDNLGFFKKSSEIEKIAQSVADSGGVEFVPALTGLGAPYWNPEARGLISGLTRGTTQAHIARAALEAIALQNADVLFAMQKDLKKKLKKLKTDGGASENNLLMQIQSDYLDVVLSRPSCVETTSLGAAYLAGLGVNLWKDTQEIKKIWKEDKSFTPKLNSKKRKERFISWKKAIQKVQSV